MLLTTPAWKLPADAEVDDFAYLDAEIPCLDRFVPIPAQRERLRKQRQRSQSAHERALARKAEKAEQARTREERKARRKAELDALKVRCGGCNRLVYPDRPCATCARKERDRREREQRALMRQPVQRVIVVMVDGSEVELPPDEYELLAWEASIHRIDLRKWVATRLGLLGLTS